MFLKPNKRRKDGKEHVYYNIKESVRIGRRTSQRTLLHLGELTTSQAHRWKKSIQVINQDGESRQMELLSDWDMEEESQGDPDVVTIRMSTLQVCRPRRFGDLWAADRMWQTLELDRFWEQHLEECRGPEPWAKVVELLAVNRLCDPSSKLAVHERWAPGTAIDFLLDSGPGLWSKDRLYRCMDKLPQYKEQLEQHLTRKWGELFHPDFNVILYDLTSTYFEGVMEEVPMAQRGYSRDHRSDCKQLVIGLVVTTEGFPLAYEIFDGNTRDCTTLASAVRSMEDKYGKANRVWVMDRGLVTDENLKQLRSWGGDYLVGTPRSQLKEFEKELLGGEWEGIRDSVEVKLCQGASGDCYVLVRSKKRYEKERAIRKRKIRGLFDGLCKLEKAVESGRICQTDVLLTKIGRLQERYKSVFRFVRIEWTPKKDDAKRLASFRFQLLGSKLRAAFRRDGIYLLRSSVTGMDASQLWPMYIQLTEVEEAFRTFKSQVGLRPIYHWTPRRIEAHILITFLAYAMHVALKWKLKSIASSLTPARVLESLKKVLLVEVWFDTADGRRICLPRITQPEKDQRLLLAQLRWSLPQQPPPRIHLSGQGFVSDCVVDSA